MKGVSIGALRARLAIEEPVSTPDGGGGAVVSWQAVAEVWASVTPVTGDERLEADATTARVTHRIVIRHRSGIRACMRLRLGDRIFQITAVLDAGARARLVLLCEERTP